MMSGRRVGKDYTANRTVAVGDKSDLTAAFGTEDLLGAGGENLGAREAKRAGKARRIFQKKNHLKSSHILG